MTNATFGLSSTGALILINENLTRIPSIRVLYMSLAVLYWLSITFKLIHYYRGLFKSHNFGQNTTLTLTICFVASNCVHTLHIVDHMYRPVDYHEAYLAYRKYLVTELEVGHYATLVTSMVGLLGIQGMLNGIQAKSRRMIQLNMLPLVFYILLGCAITTAHYLAEPPSNYGIIENFTITTSILICVPFVGLIIYAWSKTPPTVVFTQEIPHAGNRQIESTAVDDFEMW